MTTEKYDVFISYARADYKDENDKLIPGNVISKITSAFQKNDISYWIDEKGIHTGDNYGPIIAKAIQNSSVFVFVSTKSSNSSRWVQSEITLANSLKKPILPIKCDDSDYAINVILDLITLDYCDYRNFPDTAINKLVASVKEKLPEYQTHNEHKKSKGDVSSNEQIVKSLDQIASLTQFAVSRIIDSNAQSIYELRDIADSRISHLCENEAEHFRALETYLHHLEEISKITNNELREITSSIYQLREDFKHSIEQQQRTNSLLEQITSICSQLSHRGDMLEEVQSHANLFFVIDVSGSMAGDMIAGLNSAMRRFISNFNNNHPIKSGTEVDLSVISYSSDAQWQYENPTNINSYEWVDLEAGGLTNLGRAITFLNKRLGNLNVGYSSNIVPLIVFITDGVPTDSFDIKLYCPSRQFCITIGPNAGNVSKFATQFIEQDTTQLDSTLDAIMDIYLSEYGLGMYSGPIPSR